MLLCTNQARPTAKGFRLAACEGCNNAATEYRSLLFHVWASRSVLALMSCVTRAQSQQDKWTAQVNKATQHKNSTRQVNKTTRFYCLTARCSIQPDERQQPQKGSKVKTMGRSGCALRRTWKQSELQALGLTCLPAEPLFGQTLACLTAQQDMHLPGALQDAISAQHAAPKAVLAQLSSKSLECHCCSAIWMPQQHKEKHSTSLEHLLNGAFSLSVTAYGTYQKHSLEKVRLSCQHKLVCRDWCVPSLENNIAQVSITLHTFDAIVHARQAWWCVSIASCACVSLQTAKLSWAGCGRHSKLQNKRPTIALTTLLTIRWTPNNSLPLLMKPAAGSKTYSWGANGWKPQLLWFCVNLWRPSASRDQDMKEQPFDVMGFQVGACQPDIHFIWESKHRKVTAVL